MFRRPKDLAQLARLEIACKKLEDTKQLLWESGEPMLSAQASALLDRAQLELHRARISLGLSSSQAPAPTPRNRTTRDM
jgi:hypothetical protein